MLSAVILASSLLAVVLVVALVREVRLRRALQRLLPVCLLFGETAVLKTVLRCPLLLMILLLLIAIGCSPSDGRLVELGQQACDRQARQNQTIADQNRQVERAKQEARRKGHSTTE